ncbi:MAG: hypothetical protein M0036_04735 [Desulfobacteraceae bacterium]|nr:hypothetical protein [Desulfobacteraceae bacterium]
METPKATRIERLSRRRDELAARIQAAENRTARRESKNDTRRKVIVGRFFQRKYSLDGEADVLLRLLDPFLVRPQDRSLFCLDGNQTDFYLDGLSLRGVILIGAYFIQATPRAALVKKLEPVLVRSADRKLFGLPA